MTDDSRSVSPPHEGGESMDPVTPAPASGYGLEPGYRFEDPAPPEGGHPPGYGPFHLAEPVSGVGPAPSPGAEPAPGSRPSPAAPAGAASGDDSTAGLPGWSAADPVSGDAADPYGFGSGDPFGATGRPRIEPSPKPETNRFLLPLLAGLLAGLVFGTGGWLLGRTTASPAAPTATSQPPAPAPAAGAYEQNQIAINAPKLTGTLATVSQGWLPRLSGCSRSGDKGGPDLNDGERNRVRCEMDAMSVIFVEYSSAAERDKAHARTLTQNVDARELAPGVAPAGERATPSGRTSGNYVEYAYQASGRTVSAIWWDDAGSPVAAYLLAFWKDGAREKWEPMRDVWARYA
ncbi:MAG: hypothetical protein ABW000_08925 [Actinoplanes sp.]